jgi:hypothetical protein
MGLFQRKYEELIQKLKRIESLFLQKAVRAKAPLEQM